MVKLLALLVGVEEREAIIGSFSELFAWKPDLFRDRNHNSYLDDSQETQGYLE